jgi:ribosomal protein L11 methyltransferase
VGLQIVPKEGSRPEDFAASDRLLIEVYFSDPLPEVARAFNLAGWRARDVERLAEDPFESQDWLQAYRKTAAPFDVGERFRIDPGEPTGDLWCQRPPQHNAQGRFPLRIPARSAFGTGSHESTRLTMHWLERLDLTGLDVLDVGTGSGILAFACHLLGAGRVVGYDMDLETACIAQQNMSLNGIDFSLFAGKTPALSPRAAFDLLLVNVLPERIFDELPALVKRLRPGGALISSGNLTVRRVELLSRMTACGLQVQGELEAGEWVAFHLIRSTAG